MRQIIWGVTSAAIAIILAMTDYRRFYYISHYLYIITMVLLIYTCLAGHVVNGAKAWIGIGSFGIQTSEVAKITTIVFLAQFLDSTKSEKNQLSRFLISCAITFAPMLVILLQPDLGTSLVFIPILLAMAFVANVPARYIMFLLLVIMTTGVLLVLPLWQEAISKTANIFITMLAGAKFILLFVLLFGAIFALSLFGFSKYKRKYFYWICYGTSISALSLLASFAARKVLKTYQLMRLIVFLDPNVDPRGAGWHIIQSKTAIGSGGLFGKGYLQGTQSHYRFLPTQSTDFIFSIIAEEWGLIGGVIIFALFLLICFRLMRILKSTLDPFGMYICAGVASVYFFHFIINVGMTMGIMPITGIPLLFMSYGGSALLSAMCGIGICLSVYMRRFQH
jgi:rod shape determining protein RodA